MRLWEEIDLERSLKNAFAGQKDAKSQIHEAKIRQCATARKILERLFDKDEDERREIVLLADEVGLGKTYVALAVAATVLKRIRDGEGHPDLPANKPAILILTPDSDTLYNKWWREAAAFVEHCWPATEEKWLQVSKARDGSNRVNIEDITQALRQASRAKPALIIAKTSAFRAAIERSDSRRRALATFVKYWDVPPDGRRRLSTLVLDTWSRNAFPELYDLRGDGQLWNNTESLASDLKRDYELAASENADLMDRAKQESDQGDSRNLCRSLDKLSRAALARGWPQLGLVIIDEVHNLKGEETKTRRGLIRLLQGRAARVMGLSATPFQINKSELLSVLGLRALLSADPERKQELNAVIAVLGKALEERDAKGKSFREAWTALRPEDEAAMLSLWSRCEASSPVEWPALARAVGHARLQTTFERMAELERANRALERSLRPFMVRHRRNHGYRRHFVGGLGHAENERGSPVFSWQPGLSLPEDAELAQYLLMRSVSLAKDDRGRAGLGAEVTGSYRHLLGTSAAWRKLGLSRNPELGDYKTLLETHLGQESSDRRHPKIATTVRRVMRAFAAGQKSLVFCVFIKTAEAVRDAISDAVAAYLNERKKQIFGGSDPDGAFENFRRRFFNRHAPLFTLLQDQPLLEAGPSGVGIPKTLRLEPDALQELAEVLNARDVRLTSKPDRRAILAAVEHVVARRAQEDPVKRKELERLLGASAALLEDMARRDWVPDRRALGPMKHAGDPESSGEDSLAATDDAAEPGDYRGGSVANWRKQLESPVARDILSFYFNGLAHRQAHPPLLAIHHSAVLRKLDPQTRQAAGQVFRRVLMAEEFLLRYLVTKERSEEHWVGLLTSKYTEPLAGHYESLRDRVEAYFQTLERAGTSSTILDDYRLAAGNLNLIQLVKGGMKADRYFLGFNTPFRPEILVTTAVGQEGIDLHKECRHVIHHDLCWNPATIEQRTGRVDRLGSKLERERAKLQGEATVNLDIHAPYLAASYDERIFEELHKRAQLFEVTMGDDFRVDGRVPPEEVRARAEEYERMGCGAEDEDLGNASGGSILALPESMVESLRVKLAVWQKASQLATQHPWRPH